VPLTPIEKNESCYISTLVVNLLDSSTSKGELAPLKHCQKRAPKSPSPYVSLVPLRVVDTPVIKGLVSSLFAYILLVLE
jgi:hypothetical protein